MVRSAAIRKPAEPPLLLQILRYVPGALVPAIAGLVLIRLATTFLSPEQYGRFAVLMATVSLTVALASQWLRSGIARYLPPAHPGAERGALKSSALYGLVLIVAGLLAAGAILLGADIDEAWRVFVIPAVLLAVGQATYESITVILQCEMRAARFSIYRGGEALLRAALSAALLLAWPDPVALVWAAVGSSALLLPLLWRDARLPPWAELADAVQLRESLARLGRVARFGVPLIGWYAASLLLNLGDRYVIEHFRGDWEVGIYAANYQLIHGAMGLVTAPIVFASHPFLMHGWRPEHAEQVSRWLGLIFERVAIVGLFMAAGTWLFRGDLVALCLGEQFREGQDIIPVVFAGELLWNLGMYGHKPHEFLERTWTMLGWAVGCALVNLTLNVLLVPVFGYAAAAYVTVASYGLYLAVALRAGQALLRWGPRGSHLLRAALGAAVIAAAIHGARGLLAQTLGETAALLASLVAFAAAAVPLLAWTLDVDPRVWRNATRGSA